MSHGDDDAATAGNKAFQVLFSKKQFKKKHKTWENDGILVFHFVSKTVQLLDAESGQSIARKSQSSHPFNIHVGDTFSIGNKECQVEAEIDYSQFQSGACFSHESVGVSSSRPPARPFRLPIRRPSGTTISSSTRSPHPPSGALVGVEPKARHNPLAENALVLPRPPDTHKAAFNPSSKHKIVDVVVDPVISKNLRAHQKDGIQFLYSCLSGYRDVKFTGAILADEMGLGKTVQTISVIWTLLKQTPYFGSPSFIKRVLVVCPASVIDHWKQEFRKWLGDERIKVFTVDARVGAEQCLRDFISGSRIFPVLVLSYERVRAFGLDKLQPLNFDMVVCDEGHRLKDSSIRVSQILGGLRCGRRLVLSGTPIQNDLLELFAIVDFVNPGILGTISLFKRVYVDPIMKARVPGSSTGDRQLGDARQRELSRQTGEFILRRTAAVNDKYLPPKSDIVLFCPLSPLQKDLYAECLNVPCVRELKSGRGGEPEIGSHLGVLQNLRRVCNSCSLVDSVPDEDLRGRLLEIVKASGVGNEIPLHVSSKMRVLFSLLASFRRQLASDKTVVVSNFTQTLDSIQSYLEQQKLKFCRLDGTTAVDKRAAIIDSFNNSTHPDSAKIFLLSTKSGGVGLNLSGASRMILFDPDWNPANDLQAMARIWRDGQKKHVFIYRILAAGTIDEKIFQRAICKQALSDNCIDEKGDTLDKFSPRQLRDLFRLFDTDCNTHQMLKCQCKEKENQRTCKKPKVEDESDVAKCSEWIEKWWHFSTEAGDFIEDSPLFPYLDAATVDAKKDISFAFIRKPDINKS